MKAPTLYLPDTNAFSCYLSGRSEALVARMQEAFQAGTLRLSVMVLAELAFGAEKMRVSQGDTRFVRRVEALRRMMEVEPLDGSFPARYASVRAHLEVKGCKIGDRDTIIAAHALAVGAVLVTRNTREFTRVPSLVVQDWEQA